MMQCSKIMMLIRTCFCHLFVCFEDLDIRAILVPLNSCFVISNFSSFVVLYAI